MKITNEQSLSSIQEQKKNQDMIPISLATIGQELVQEKLSHAQTQQLVSMLGQELVKANLRIATLEGGNA